LARGGIYGGDIFENPIVKYMLKVHDGMESFQQMYDKYDKCPLANKWWNDKRPDYVEQYNAR
jgi:hypothetical protein